MRPGSNWISKLNMHTLALPRVIRIAQSRSDIRLSVFPDKGVTRYYTDDKNRLRSPETFGHDYCCRLQHLHSPATAYTQLTATNY
jgi:hypothetical protein